MNALDMLRERKKGGVLSPPVNEQELPQFLTTFFTDGLPLLPANLLPFELLHRHATTGSLPTAKAVQVIDAINDAANRKGLRLEVRVEELAELDAWFTSWLMDRVEVDQPDPYEER